MLVFELLWHRLTGNIALYIAAITCLIFLEVNKYVDPSDFQNGVHKHLSAEL